MIMPFRIYDKKTVSGNDEVIKRKE